jgi:hypothetical protein
VGELPHTVEAGERLLRLPLWLALGGLQDEVIAQFSRALAEAPAR